MLRAFGTWPAANSCGSRTSTIVQGGGPTASSKSPKLTMSGSEPAPKRENMFQDISPPKSYGRPPSNSTERVSYRSPGPRFEGFLFRRDRPCLAANYGDVATRCDRISSFGSAEWADSDAPKKHS